MLKYAFLMTAAAVASPALAQTQQAPAQGGEIAAGRTPIQAETGTAAPATGAPAQAAPAAPDQTAATRPTPDATQGTPVPAQTADAQPQQAAAGGDQVAQVVGQEFKTYDKDANGSLSQAEFGAWMVALKTASDPSTKAEAPATKKWVGAAFAQADKDKSRSLSQTELTGFLSQGQS